jgi:alpha-1,2-mannosyltransferase
VPRKLPSDWWLILALLAGLYLWQRTVVPVWIGDVFPDQLAAYYLRTGNIESVYAPERTFDNWLTNSIPVAQSLGLDCDLCAYMYPPFVAGILTPFAEIPAPYWRDALLVINILLLFVFSRQMMLLLDQRRNLRVFLWALAVVLLCYPMARATKLSQPVPLLVALTWAGLLWLRKGMDIPAGVALGIAAAVKLFPVVLLLLPLLDRRFRPLAAALATIAVIYVSSVTLWGMRLHVLWWECMREFSQQVIPYWGNQSPLSWLARTVFGYSIMHGRPVQFPELLILRIFCGLIFGVSTLWALWKLRSVASRSRLALAAGLILSAVLLSVPIAWEHYWLFVLPVLVWILFTEWTNGASWNRLWWLGAAAFFFLMKFTHFYSESSLGRFMTGTHTIGLVLLWLYLMERAMRGQREVPADITAIA